MIELIPTQEIRQYEDRIETLIADLDSHAVSIANDEYSGAAFRRSLLFANSAALQDTALSHLTAIELFYNQYYWFFLFIKLHQIKHGHDAGLEQQAYQLLETAPNSVDWNIMEEIHNRAESEAKSYQLE